MSLDFMAEEVQICPRCENEIDPEVCHCGDYIKDHGYNSGHSPVPMGCTCGYAKELDEHPPFNMNFPKAKI
jgi:predicted amidophosphoribosyltransferase